jgi:hypothetical protein
LPYDDEQEEHHISPGYGSSPRLIRCGDFNRLPDGAKPHENGAKKEKKNVASPAFHPVPRAGASDALVRSRRRPTDAAAVNWKRYVAST